MPPSASARTSWILAGMAALVLAGLAVGGCVFEGDDRAEPAAACGVVCACDAPAGFPAQRRECVRTCVAGVEQFGASDACLRCVAGLTCDQLEGEATECAGACSQGGGDPIDDGGDGTDLPPDGGVDDDVPPPAP